MTKKKKKQETRKQQAGLRKRKQPNWPITLLAGAGMALTLYLAFNEWLGGAPLYCAAGSSCDIVQQSRWGTFLGMPTAFWGFLTYTTLAFIGFKVRNPERHWKATWIVGLLGLGYSVYLTSVSLFVIDALCAYCLVSLSIMTAIFGTVVAQRPAGMENFRFPVWIAETAVVVLLVIGGMHLHYSGVFDPAAGPEDPYLQGLATHLSRNDAVMYGAFWCPACQEQKFLFESSAELLPYLECTPGGRGTPQTAECSAKGIRTYPTWIIGGTKYEGLLKPERLAAISGYTKEK